MFPIARDAQILNIFWLIPYVDACHVGMLGSCVGVLVLNPILCTAFNMIAAASQFSKLAWWNAHVEDCRASSGNDGAEPNNKGQLLVTTLWMG